MLLQMIDTIRSGGEMSLSQMIMQILAVLFVIFCVLPLHECAHGWMAYKLGDDTAKREERLTMNPLASIDPMGAASILLFGFGWAKPVPVDPRNFKNPKGGMALTALAGPVANLLAAVVGALLSNLLVVTTGLAWAWTYWILYFLRYYFLINVMLAVFNLIPLPPLDGSRIVGAFLSDKALYKYYQYQRYIMMILFVLMLMNVLDYPLNVATSAVGQVLQWIAALPFHLFGY